MRFGTKLVALSAIASLAAPASGGASEYHHISEYVREVRISSEVSAIKNGVLKKGVMSLVFRYSQGVQYDQPQQAGSIGVFSAAPFLGLGVQTQTTGLPRSEVCFSIHLPTIMSYTNRCQVFGIPYFNSDPLMSEVELGVTMGPPDDWRQTITLDLEGTGDLQREPKNSAGVTPNLATPRTYGFNALVNEMHHRPGIIVGGQITDPRHPLIYVNAASSVGTMRTGLVHDSSFVRGPVACTAGLGIPIGYPAGSGLPIIGPFLHPDLNGDGKGDMVSDYMPPGCYPDDPLGI